MRSFEIENRRQIARLQLFDDSQEKVCLRFNGEGGAKEVIGAADEPSIARILPMLGERSVHARHALGRLDETVLKARSNNGCPIDGWLIMGDVDPGDSGGNNLAVRSAEHSRIIRRFPPRTAGQRADYRRLFNNKGK